MRRMMLTIAILGALSAAGLAQQRSPSPVTFEVASIRQNISGSADSSLNTPPTGVVTGTNVPVRQLILAAYRVHRTRLIGGPDWISSDRYDVIAKRPDNVPADQLPRLWESLLRERFKLRVHTETRELPVYRLVVGRRDGKLGPRLTRATIDCPALTAGATRPVTPVGADGRPRCNTRGSMNNGQGTISIAGMPMAQLAEMLTFVGTPDRIVVDRTGLDGTFDAEVQWRVEPTRTVDTPPQGELLSIFTAVQEQLGLRLEPAREPVEVIVIDSIERPTPD